MNRPTAYSVLTMTTKELGTIIDQLKITDKLAGYNIGKALYARRSIVNNAQESITSYLGKLKGVVVDNCDRKATPGRNIDTPYMQTCLAKIEEAVLVIKQAKAEIALVLMGINDCVWEVIVFPKPE